MTEYAILYYLLLRGFIKKFRDKNQAFFIALFVTIIYAISDEIHQTFVPTREGRIRDVIFDTAGAMLMFVSIKYKFVQLRQHRML